MFYSMRSDSIDLSQEGGISNEQLLANQVEKVKQTQVELETVLLDIENAKTEEEYNQLIVTAQKLERMCQRHMLVLNMAHKIYADIQWHREELIKPGIVGREMRMVLEKITELENQLQDLVALQKAPQESRSTAKGFHKTRPLSGRSDEIKTHKKFSAPLEFSSQQQTMQNIDEEESLSWDYAGTKQGHDQQVKSQTYVSGAPSECASEFPDPKEFHVSHLQESFRETMTPERSLQDLSHTDDKHQATTKSEKRIFPPLPSMWIKVAAQSQSLRLQPQEMNQYNLSHQIGLALQQPRGRKHKTKRDRSVQKLWVASFPAPDSLEAKNKCRVIDVQKDPMKWQRLQGLVQSLNSDIMQERKDAAKALGWLGANNDFVISGLCTTLQTSKNPNLTYEAAKALILLGCWEKNVVRKWMQYLNVPEVREDILLALVPSLQTWASSPENQRFPIHATTNLIDILEKIVASEDSSGNVNLQAATCLAYLDANSEHAMDKLLSCLNDKSTRKKMQAIDVLVLHLKVHNDRTIQAILDQLEKSTVYKHRVQASALLGFIGIQPIQAANMEEKVFEMLRQKLHCEPLQVVKQSVAVTIDALGVKKKMWDIIEKQLKEKNEKSRKEAVISLGILGLRRNWVLRLLLEMLELDKSDMIRFQIIRAFTHLGLKDATVLRSLQLREQGDGRLAKEASKALKILLKAD
ncbi:protein HEATR9 [Latimeria chalumnae]|uniref:HEAT repeat containing 9 n=1 Tax=Latimeria chalumnae TaxID=7897 RepID=M3XGX1_LATCH|nr:PREDICTED: protein HEATR9 [Latimeria chalumnae]|eukprot:XP_005998339.2 PREDICTED: protein HEATR9 [Latimeria chalumnae]